ncbi:hypothetical protein [Rhodoplanes sp. Z2-YC6860]|nr:hypothetical protein [Rhodoplanes sp. Z2-YC6860]
MKATPGWQGPRFTSNISHMGGRLTGGSICMTLRGFDDEDWDG